MPGHLTFLLLALVRGDDETCLLHLKSQLDRVDVPNAGHSLTLTATGNVISFHAALEAQQTWRKRHTALKTTLQRFMRDAPESSSMDVIGSTTLSSSTEGIERFIQRSKDSEQTCFAKIVEVRRSLDGIIAKVNALSDVTEGHEAIVEGNTEVITQAKDGQKDQQKEFEKALEACDDTFNEAMLALQVHREDQIEMEAIANPEVRSKIGYHTNYTKEVEEHKELVQDSAARHVKMEAQAALARKALEEQQRREAEAKAAKQAALEKAAADLEAQKAKPKTALLSVEMDSEASLGASLALRIHHLSMEQCGQLVQKLARVGDVPTPIPVGKVWQDDDATMEACNGTRHELQKKFNETWDMLSKLIKDGEDLAKKELKACKLAAEAEHEEKMDAFEDKVDKATGHMQAAMEALKQLTSLLRNAREEADLLEAYIKKLKEDCEIQEDVSDHIKGVLEMIKALEDCPGRNDFRLVVPGSLTTRIGIGSPSTTPEPLE